MSRKNCRNHCPNQCRSGGQTGRHRSRGAVLVEGVAALFLIITGTMLAISFLVSSGMLVYYKQKMGFISTQIAQQVGMHPQMDDMTMTEMTRDMMAKMSLPTANMSVSRSNTDVYGRPGVAITVKNGKLPLFTNVDFLPMTIDIQDTAVAFLSASPSGADAYLWMPRGRMSSYVLPMVRIPNGGTPQFSTVPVIQY